MERDWAQQQTTCPDGHDVRWSAGGKASWESCRDCPADNGGGGHNELWCPTERRWYLPPNCRRRKT